MRTAHKTTTTQTQLKTTFVTSQQTNHIKGCTYGDKAVSYVVKIIGENTVKSLEPSLDAAISSSGSF